MVIERSGRSTIRGMRAMTTVAISNTTASDEQHVIDVIVLAFSADPAARRMFPDPTQYLRHFPKFVKAFGGRAFRHGTAYHIDGFLGAALWLPPDVHPDEEPLAGLIAVCQPCAPSAARGHLWRSSLQPD